jgi:AsmA protein
MVRLIKILVWLLLIVVVLIGTAVVVAPLVLDPNDFKGDIITQVKERTGRDLKIDGDLKLSVFPWLGIEIGEVELGNAPGFGDQPFAAAKSAAVRVKLMPLLDKELVVDTIGVDGLVLNLAKAKDGHTNWDDLMAAEEPAAAKGAAEPGTEGGGLAKLAIGGVDIQDGRISWDDRQTGEKYEISGLLLKSGAIEPGRPVALETGLTLKQAKPQLTAKLRLTGTVVLDEEAGRLIVSDLQAEVDATGEAIPRGNLRATLATALGLALDGSSVTLDRLNLTSGNLQLTGNLKGSDLGGKPAFSGALKLTPFNLRGWLQSQGMTIPETADAGVLTRFGAETTLAARSGATELEKLSINLDDTHVTGGARLRGEAIGFDLNVDAIDLDRYLPPKREEQAGAGSGAAGGGDEELLPVETLRGLNLSGSLAIGRLVVNRLKAEDVRINVKAAGGQLHLDQRISRFYEGSYRGSTDVDVRSATPLVRSESALADIQAGPLLKDLNGSDRLSGKGRFNAKLNARGNSANSWKRTLAGNLDFRFENGAVKGINLAQTIRETKALFEGKPAPKSNEPVQTDFSELSGTGVIANGILTNRDLSAKSPYLRVNGAGTVNLVSEATDYDLRTVIVGTGKGQGGKELADLEGVTIPVHVSGRYSDPKYSVNWAEVLTSSQKAKLQEKLQEQLQGALGGKSAGDNAGDNAGDTSGSSGDNSTDGKKSLQDQLKGKLKGLKF